MASDISMNDSFYKYIKVDRNTFIWLMLLNAISITVLFVLIYKSEIYYPYSNISAFYDVEYYLSIAQKGYNLENPRLYAFMPLFPMVIRHLSIGSPILFASLLNNVLLFFSSVLLYRIFKEIFLLENQEALKSVAFFIFNPFRFVFFIPYTESLFIFLTLLSWYLWKKKANPWLWGLTLGMSILTRNLGAVLALCIGFISALAVIFSKEYKQIRYYCKAAFITIMTGSQYAIYLYFTTGSFTKFIEVQYSVWHRIDYALPFEMLLHDLKNHPLHLQTILSVISLFLLVKLTLLFIKNNGYEHVELSLFSLCSIIVFLSCGRSSAWTTPASASTGRYVFGLFNLYIFFINAKLKRLTLAFFIIISILIASLSILNNAFLV